MVTERECLDALREAADVLGESPTKEQYEALGVTPSASTILRHCGGWNAAKERAGLDTNRSTGSRVAPKPDDVDLPPETEWASLTQDQRWHYKHRELNNRRTLRRRQRLREWLDTYKRESDGCVRCGVSAPAILDFHHENPADKEMAVNEMVPYGYSKADIRTEVEKCVLLCANCHAKEHRPRPVSDARLDDLFEDTGQERDGITEDDLPSAGANGLAKSERLRAWTCAYKRDRRCQHCGETDPACLQFHHTGDDKEAGIGAMIADSYPQEDVLAEVRKCVVLCANCHRREHHPSAADPGGNDSV